MPAATEGAADPDEGRSARKRRVILETATELFLRNGYLGTSMDEVASVAGVSKQTVYKHFADKEGLFQAIALATIDQVRGPFYDLVPSLGNVDVEADLRALARGLVAIVMRPQLLQLRRLVIAEAGRFPELGRAYFPSAVRGGPQGRSQRASRSWRTAACWTCPTPCSPGATSCGWSCRSRSTR